MGGLLYGGIETKPSHKERHLEAAETAGDTLALVTWVVFGAVLISSDHAAMMTWQVWAYAALSLTVVRMLPVMLVLCGSGLKLDEQLFIGWFGPRGLASIVFAVIVKGAELPHGNLVVTATVCTILLSVVLHGLSANPLVACLKARERARAPLEQALLS